MKKPLVFLCAGLLGLLALSTALVVGCHTQLTRGLPMSIAGLSEKATRDDVQRLELAPGQTLRVNIRHGDVHVQADTRGEPSVSSTITAWGRTRGEAQKALDNARIDVQQTADGVTITLVGGTIEEAIPGGKMTISANADLRIRVPEKVLLALETDSGDLDARGPFGASKLHSRYGKVRVSGVDGDVAAESSSGDVSVSGAAGGKVLARTDYGDVTVARSDSPEIEARSGSGDVGIESVHALHVKVETDYGDVDLVLVQGDVEARLSSGDAHARDIKGERISIASAYGDIWVEKASGTLEARTESGAVHVSEFDGRIALRSSYGGVQAEGTFTEVLAESSSGTVDVQVLQGSRVQSPWKLSSAYGDVILRLPDEFACDLVAKTDYGDLDFSYPVAVDSGEVKNREDSVRGRLNGGGGAVTLMCGSGDVRIQRHVR